MNLQIKKLFEQATEVVPEKVWDENNGMYYSENRSRLNSEKFAELIVRNVLDQVDEFNQLTKAYQALGVEPEIDISKEVLKNFGVEE